jgi:hypothetical protein
MRWMMWRAMALADCSLHGTSRFNYRNEGNVSMTWRVMSACLYLHRLGHLHKIYVQHLVGHPPCRARQKMGSKHQAGGSDVKRRGLEMC